MVSYLGNVPFDRIHHVLEKEGFTCDETVANRDTLSVEAVIMKAGVDPTTTEKDNIKSIMKDFGLHVIWI